MPYISQAQRTIISYAFNHLRIEKESNLKQTPNLTSYDMISAIREEKEMTLFDVVNKSNPLPIKLLKTMEDFAEKYEFSQSSLKNAYKVIKKLFEWKETQSINAINDVVLSYNDGEGDLSFSWNYISLSCHVYILPNGESELKLQSILGNQQIYKFPDENFFCDLGKLLVKDQYKI